MIDPYVNDGEGGFELRTTSPSLLERVRGDDPEAWSQLVRECAPVIYLWCRWEGVLPDDAAELSQDILLSVYKRLETFHKEDSGDTFRGWLRRITKHQVVDFYRRLVRRPLQARGGDDHLGQNSRNAESAPELDSEQQDGRFLALERATERIRKRCDERTWEIFTCYVTDGFTAEETARSFGVSIGYVHQVRARMLRRYRKELNGPTDLVSSPDES